MSTDEDTQTHFDTQKTVKIRLFVCVERKGEEEEEEEEEEDEFNNNIKMKRKTLGCKMILRAWFGITERKATLERAQHQTKKKW